MICVVIKGPTFEEAHQQMAKALAYADIIELRLDHFSLWDLKAVERFRSHFSIPMIFTLRSQRQGGGYALSEENRLADIRALLELQPEYMDLECDVSSSFIAGVSSRFPRVKLILSYHNFKETPENLEDLYRDMRKIPAHFYKIAVTAKHSLDALRLICWAKKSDNKLIAISMGYHGQISRILAPVIGCPITYAALEEEQDSSLGQLSAQALIERYHCHSLNPHTALYGLIGDPVDQSISDETHNNLMRAYGLDAVYVKIQIRSSELPVFFLYARELPFHGLSVTMPLKEDVLSFLDHIDSQARNIGAVNTLLMEEGRIFGFNTDGMGALNAIKNECDVKDKHMVILGAGGASKAIAYEASQRGAKVTIVNRDISKALHLAEHLNAVGKGLDEMPSCAKAGYDLLINTTPVSLPIAFDDILSKSIVMDIKTKPKETLFLKNALEKECRVVYGYQMFIEQALEQFKLWFKDQIDIQESRKILESKAVEVLAESV